jgi:hypothetical protein
MSQPSARICPASFALADLKTHPSAKMLIHGPLILSQAARQQ